MPSAAPLKVLFYGDDFTGSSENLAQYHRSGAKARLYLNTPSKEQLSDDAGRFDVLGIAGTARALSNEDMRFELDQAFAAMAAVDCKFIQYKICSTFDSSPEVGSFGVALEAAHYHFGVRPKAVLAATPDFGRHTVFGNHFVRFGTETLRLDRHPSMANHPKTPMSEADLRLHLQKQTPRHFRNFTIADYQDERAFAKNLEAAFAADVGAVFDAANNDDLEFVAQKLWGYAKDASLFGLAAQGLAQALGKLWQEDGLLTERRNVVTSIPGVASLLVLSGSCALQNGKQIDVAEEAGWKTVRFDPKQLVDKNAFNRAVEDTTREVGKSLETGRPTIVYTAKGEVGRIDSDAVPAAVLGSAYSEIARAMRARLHIPRIVYSGGDSSSYAVKLSGAQALEIAVFDKQQSSHVCRLSAPDREGLDGLEVMLKGGQVGGDDYFLRALHGTQKAA